MSDTSTMIGASANQAMFSPCGTYRYLLTRTLREGLFGEASGNAVAFIMLNPSTADAMLNDPTIRRCLGYAHRWGFRRLLVGNLFALRATDPRELYRHEAPIGPENDHWLRQICAAAQSVICAWGTHGIHLGRDLQVLDLIRDCRRQVHHLGMTTGGQPRHPLYMANDVEPILWRR